MRVLVLTPDYPPAPGGIQLLMSRLVSNLPDVDAKVVTLAFDEDGTDLSGDERVLYAGRRGTSGNKFSNLQLNVRGVGVGARFRPDIVISGHAVSAPGAAAVQSFMGVPMLQYIHADEARLRPRLMGFAVRRAEAVVAVSRHARQLALQGGCHVDRVQELHPGVDRPRRPPRSRSPTGRRS